MSHEQTNIPQQLPQGKPIRYLSVCSGMEAASVAWHPLGWKPVGFSEIEPFPCAILKHRFPDVPNYGDLTKYAEWPLSVGDVDLICGGTPCQAFSVAGLRQGLADPRGNLALVFLGLVDRLRPKYVLWENVPGVLSSNGGEDFAAFLGALAELGYGFAWRCVDAQFFGVPQRRKRVYLLAVQGAGNWRAAAEILFEPEGLRGDFEASRKAREEAAADAGSNVEASGLHRTVGTLCADTHPGAYSGQDAYTGRLIPQSFTPSSFGQYAEGIGTIRANGGDIGGGSEGLVVNPVPFRKSKRAQSTTDNETWVPADVTNTLNNFDLGDTRTTHAVVEQKVYENHPNDSRVTGPHKVCPTVVSRFGTGGGNIPFVNNEPVVDPTVTTCKGSRGGCSSEAIDEITAIHKAQGVDLYNQTLTGDLHVPLRTAGGHGAPAVIEPIAFDTYNQSVSPISKTLSCAASDVDHVGAVVYPVAAAFKSGQGSAARSIGWDENVSPTLPANAGGNTAPAVIGTMTAMAVRRLTPIECERLQGFPDNWSRIPWKGKPETECPDGPRYKACGNSMAVPCMFWIGNRIAQYEARA